MWKFILKVIFEEKLFILKNPIESLPVNFKPEMTNNGKNNKKTRKPSLKNYFKFPPKGSPSTARPVRTISSC